MLFTKIKNNFFWCVAWRLWWFLFWRWIENCFGRSGKGDDGAAKLVFVNHGAGEEVLRAVDKVADHGICPGGTGRITANIEPQEVYAGEDEMGALAMNATMFLNNEIECKEYK